MKDLLHSILNIFVHAGRLLSMVRNALFNTLMLLVLLVAAIGFFASGPAPLPVNSVLKLSLAGDIVEERRPTTPFADLLAKSMGAEDEPEFMVMQDILDIIEAAAFDPAIQAILLDLQNLGQAGLDQLQTIGKALDVFRHQGKKVFAAEDFYTQKQYYLASHADTIILNPMGGVEMHGFGLYPLYFRDALDKLQVNYHIFRVGTYKSAIEPITRNSMSEEARSQNLEWLNVLWATYLRDVARQRGLTTETLSGYIDNIQANLSATGGDTARLALNSRLVDLLLTREELNNHLQSATGSIALDLVSTKEYLSRVEPSFTETDGDKPGIGVIVAEGNILGGEQPAGVIGSDSLTTLLRTARERDDIKSVVLRINSGGGSAFASEIIRQEILELKKAGKPVVVSMGTMAASGGYWISANADQIWASPVTLTGSIGIFGAIPTFEQTLANLGVYSDGVGTTALSAGANLAQPLKPEIKAAIQLTVDHGYRQFLEIVENGRKIGKDKLPLVAEGRVFSGERAKELGLVDSLGTLDEAIDAAAELAGVSTYSPVYIEPARSIRDEILQNFTASARALFPEFRVAMPVHGLYSQLRKQLGEILVLHDPQGIYAHAMLQLPF